MTSGTSAQAPDQSKPLQRPGLAAGVARYVQNAIMSGELKSGERIDQAAIADLLGVSKLPVREALIALEAEGFIDLKPRRGAFVSALTPEDILDHYIIFGRVAGIAAERAALVMTPESLVELRRVHVAMTHTTEAGELARLNERFHQIISRAAGSNRLKHVLRTFSESLPNAFFEFAGGREELECTAAEHELILTSLVARDASTAGKAMAEHFEARGREAQRALAVRGFWSDQIAEAEQH